MRRSCHGCHIHFFVISPFVPFSTNKRQTTCIFIISHNWQQQANYLEVLGGAEHSIFTFLSLVLVVFHAWQVTLGLPPWVFQEQGQSHSEQTETIHNVTPLARADELKFSRTTFGELLVSDACLLVC